MAILSKNARSSRCGDRFTVAAILSRPLMAARSPCYPQPRGGMAVKIIGQHSRFVLSRGANAERRQQKARKAAAGEHNPGSARLSRRS